jgi:MYXO-CTERM domain-containing protein
MNKPVALALWLAILGSLGVAEAHTLLAVPAPLTNDDNAKSGPCGCYFGSPEDPNEDATALACPAQFDKTDLVAGEPLLVVWVETVNHDGSFRLAFSDLPVTEVSKADLAAGVLYDEPDQNDTSGATIETTISVPNEPCESCTLQLRQDMGGSFYYSCAAIRILPAAGSSAATTSAATTTGSAGAGGEAASTGAGPGSGAGGAPASTGPGMADPPSVITSGACSAAPAGRAPSTSFAGALVLAAAAWLRRRIA